MREVEPIGQRSLRPPEVDERQRSRRRRHFRSIHWVAAPSACLRRTIISGGEDLSSRRTIPYFNLPHGGEQLQV